MFAVIKTGGKQYRVIANQLVKVEKIVGNIGDIVEFRDVLMVCEGNNATVGAPVVSGAMVTAEIVEQGRLRKVISFKKRRRQNSKRTRGHRQEITTLRVLEILTGDLKPKKATEKLAEKKAAARKEVKSADSLKKTAGQTSKKKVVSQKDSVVTSDE
ncbi:50S ribosomal protein L21 [Bartonella sp. cb54]|uniref:50S ribosomal protein L21 n=1 Tax=Bartonella sp. cb54 TaxID=3385560 RepID=UPI0039A724BE